MKSRIPRLLLVALLAVPFPARAQENLVKDGPRGSLNLDGSWQILPIQGLKFSYPPPATGWKDTPVPESVSPAIISINNPYTPQVKDLLSADGSGFKQTEKIAAWYRRDFQMPAATLVGARVVLHFGGMAFRSQVWFNGTKVGESVQGLVPTDYDVTSQLRPGQKNSIVVGLAGREALVDLAAKTFIAPNSGVQAGIWGDVELRVIPEVSVSDVFVKTFVAAKRIEFETTISNAGKTARTITPSIAIFDAFGKLQATLSGQPLKVASGQQKTVTLQKVWLAPHLWAPETPVLYNARIDLRSGVSIVDSFVQPFGFREFAIRGRDFFLNGKRIVMLRNSYLTDLSAPAETVNPMVRGDVGRPYNTARLHLGFDNQHVIEAADKFGLMLTPEFGWYHTNAFPPDKSAAWLPNTLDYARRFVRLNRNHPSVMIWNLTNETFWGNTDDNMMKAGEQILATVKALDPTRPQEGDGETTWGGRLPIISIHYPESTVGPLRAKYPNSGHLEPNDLYWLTKDGTNTSWRSSFAWDRPLFIGEYLETGGSPEERFGYLGEEMYDFEKWRQQDFVGMDGQKNDFAESIRRATDVYRMQGVAGLNPWAGNRQEVLAPVAVRPLDFHPNFFSGRTGTHKVVVFNDSGISYASMNLQCRLAVNGKTVWEKIINSPVDSGQNATFDITFDCPTVAGITAATLSVRLRFERGGSWAQLGRHEETIYIMPVEHAVSTEFGNMVLLDSKGATAGALHQLGLDIPAKTALTEVDLANTTTLIVGAETDPQPFRGLIEAFVRKGGKLMLLNQNYGAPLLPQLAQTDDLHVSTRSWKRDYANPILTGLDEAQLSYWMPDNIVSTQTLQKPSIGKYKVILDASGRFGLSWTPLLETEIGSGIVLQSQLNLVDRVAQEPVAGPLLLRILRYCHDYKPATALPLRVLVGKNDAFQLVLQTCSLAVSNGLEGNGPVLLDSSYTPSSAEIAQLKSFVEAGGKVWLHGFNSTNIDSIAALFPFKPQLTKYDPTIQSAARRSNDPLMAGISSQEFYWTRVEMSARADYYGQAQSTAKLGGGEVLTLPNAEAGEKLVEPGLLVKVPSGKGVLLFDTLSWENALGAETTKVSRLVTTLARNMGADIQVAAEKTYAYSQADLSQKANMGFYDEVAGDGKGGWTDQGPNDMRYFLINHTGMTKGGGMEVGVGEFPSVANFAGRPFQLVDPKKNGGRSVIALKGQEHGPTLPADAKDIAFGHKADKLWFLQTACWAPTKQLDEVGRYIIHYDDGTQSVFPLRYGIEVSDWWDPKPLSSAKVGWSGQNDLHSPIGLYVTEWTNPEPTKIIKTIDLIGSESPTQIVLVGISGGTEIDASAAYKPVADWNLGEAKAGVVANAVGQGSLSFGTQAPTVVASGLHFNGGQFLRADGKTIPAVGAGGPFNLEMMLTPEAKPDGYYGGLFQDMDYLKSGFRVMLDQQMRVAVDIFPGDGKGRSLVGKTPLSPGKTYDLELKFDGQRAYLFVDKKLDASLETQPPAPYAGEISIGRAGGQNYNYNGTISRISVSVPSAEGK